MGDLGVIEFIRLKEAYCVYIYRVYRVYLVYVVRGWVSGFRAKGSRLGFRVELLGCSLKGEVSGWFGLNRFWGFGGSGGQGLGCLKVWGGTRTLLAPSNWGYMVSNNGHLGFNRG